MPIVFNYTDETLNRFRDNFLKTHLEKDVLKYLNVLASALQEYTKIGCYHTVLEAPLDLKGEPIEFKTDVFNRSLKQHLDAHLNKKLKKEEKRYKKRMKEFKESGGMEPTKASISKFRSNIHYFIAKEYALPKKEKTEKGVPSKKRVRETVPHYHAVFYVNGYTLSELCKYEKAIENAVELREIISKAWLVAHGINKDDPRRLTMLENITKTSYQLLDQNDIFFWNYYKQEIVRGAYMTKICDKMDGKKREQFYYSSKLTHSFPYEVITESINTMSAYECIEFSRHAENNGNFKMLLTKPNTITPHKQTNKEREYIRRRTEKQTTTKTLPTYFLYESNRKIFWSLNSKEWITGQDKERELADRILDNRVKAKFKPTFILEGTKLTLKSRSCYKEGKRIVNEFGDDLELLFEKNNPNCVVYPKDETMIMVNRRKVGSLIAQRRGFDESTHENTAEFGDETASHELL